MAAICMIGNSHLAPLKRGWPEVQSAFPDFALDFYASIGGSLQLEVSDGRLVAAHEKLHVHLATKSGKSGDIEPTYDAYVVCGLGLQAMSAIEAYMVRLVQLRESGTAKAKRTEDLIAAMELVLRASLAVDILSKLRRITAAPIFLIPTC